MQKFAYWDLVLHIIVPAAFTVVFALVFNRTGFCEAGVCGVYPVSLPMLLGLICGLPGAKLVGYRMQSNSENPSGSND